VVVLAFYFIKILVQFS